MKKNYSFLTGQRAAVLLLALLLPLGGCTRQTGTSALSGTSSARTAASPSSARGFSNGSAASGGAGRSSASSAAQEPRFHTIQGAGTGDFSVSLIAAGDDLIHNMVYEDAARNADGKGYDFAPMYRYLRPTVSACDFAFVNQETPLAGAVLPLSNYPCFNSPTQVGTALIGAGFNLISQANNHSMDKGFTGVKATCAFWAAQKGVVMSGMYTSQDDYDTIRYLKKGGATLAFIAGTSVDNGIAKPSGKSWCLEDGFANILAKVRAARKTADIVLVSMHWGVEYQNTPTDSQKQQASQLAAAGADIIIGNHPHDIQPVQWVESGGRRAIVAYALGNLISSQDKFITMVGGLLRMQVTRKNGVLSVGSVRFIPVVTFFTKSFTGFCTVPLSDYTDAMAGMHALSPRGIDMSAAHVRSYVRSVVSSEFFS